MRNAIMNIVGMLALFFGELLRAPMRAVRNVDRDKLEHFVVGVMASCLPATLLAHAAFAQLPMAKALAFLAGIGLIAAAGAGLLKEALDWVERERARSAGLSPWSHPDLADFMATFLGGVPLALVLGVAAWVLA